MNNPKLFSIKIEALLGERLGYCLWVFWSLLGHMHQVMMAAIRLATPIKIGTRYNANTISQNSSWDLYIKLAQ